MVVELNKLFKNSLIFFYIKGLFFMFNIEKGVYLIGGLKLNYKKIIKY